MVNTSAAAWAAATVVTVAPLVAAWALRIVLKGDPSSTPLEAGRAIAAVLAPRWHRRLPPPLPTRTDDDPVREAARSTP